MPSVGFTGKGGVVSISTDGTTFTTIGQVKSVKFGGQKADFADITNLGSSGNIREKIPTLIDPGTVSLEIVSSQVEPGQLALSAAFFAQTELTVKVQYPPQPGYTTGLIRKASCYVSSDGMADLNVADASTYTTELMLTGPITDTPAVPTT